MRGLCSVFSLNVLANSRVASTIISNNISGDGAMQKQFARCRWLLLIADLPRNKNSSNLPHLAAIRPARNSYLRSNRHNSPMGFPPTLLLPADILILPFATVLLKISCKANLPGKLSCIQL